MRYTIMKKLFYILCCALAVMCTACANTHKVHEYVDLGLPSGIKWATCNVGAESPEDYGDYFAWGEIEPKDYYDWSTYKWCEGDSITQTKYCTDSSCGTVDNKIILDISDDAANANWGGDWRMPTTEELEELSTKCTWTWEQKNGVNGCTVTGPNGNSIFLPAAGVRYESSLGAAGTYGCYWGRLLNTGKSDHAYGLNFNLNNTGSGYDDRYIGFCVRPVCPVMLEANLP
jgi:hypothetical protein